MTCAAGGATAAAAAAAAAADDEWGTGMRIGQRGSARRWAPSTQAGGRVGSRRASSPSKRGVNQRILE